jgi:filamentous hemagglutinin
MATITPGDVDGYVQGVNNEIAREWGSADRAAYDPTIYSDILEDAAAAGIFFAAGGSRSDNAGVPSLGKGSSVGETPNIVGETPHTVSGSRPPNGGRTGEPNSIWEQIRDDGRSVTYFDEQGRWFSREDYGQRSPHGSLGQDVSGRTVPHEHRYNYSDQGPTGKQYRELDENGRPISDWFDD